MFGVLMLIDNCREKIVGVLWRVKQRERGDALAWRRNRPTPDCRMDQPRRWGRIIDAVTHTLACHCPRWRG